MTEAQLELPKAPADPEHRLFKQFVLKKEGQEVALAGHISDKKGRVRTWEGISDEHKEAARQLALSLCAQIKGVLDKHGRKFVQLLHLEVWVSAIEGHKSAHLFANEISLTIKDWLRLQNVAEEDCCGTRVAISVAGLPMDATMEVRATFVMTSYREPPMGPG